METDGETIAALHESNSENNPSGLLDYIKYRPLCQQGKQYEETVISSDTNNLDKPPLCLFDLITYGPLCKKVEKYEQPESGKTLQDVELKRKEMCDTIEEKLKTNKKEILRSLIISGDIKSSCFSTSRASELFSRHPSLNDLDIIEKLFQPGACNIL